MRKIKPFFKLAYLIPFLCIAFVMDVVLFAIANSCSACNSLPSYLQSSYSIANATLLSISSALGSFKR